MGVYCLCIASTVRDNQTIAPSHGRAIDKASEVANDLESHQELGVALPERPAKVRRIGVERYLSTLGPNHTGLIDHTPVRQHYPNIDIRTCPYCGASFAVE